MVQYELWLNIMQGTDFEVSVTDTPKMFRLVPFRYTFLFVLDLIGSLRCLPIDMHNNNNTKKKAHQQQHNTKSNEYRNFSGSDETS